MKKASEFILNSKNKKDSLKKFIFHHIWPYFHPVRTLEWAQLKTFSRECPPSKVLSLGCGTGFFEHRLHKKYPHLRLIGLDLSHTAIADAMHYHRKQGKVDFCLADACQLPFGDLTFDAAIAVCAFEHFFKPEEVLAEIFRVLHSEGKLWLSVDAFDHSSIKNQHREKFRVRHRVINFYPLNYLSELLNAHGFRVKQYRYLLRSKGAGWVYHINSAIKFHGWEAAEPMVYFFLRLLTIFSDIICGTKDSGYILTISARRIDQ